MFQPTNGWEFPMRLSSTRVAHRAAGVGARARPHVGRWNVRDLPSRACSSPRHRGQGPGKARGSGNNSQRRSHASRRARPRNHRVQSILRKARFTPWVFAPKQRRRSRASAATSNRPNLGCQAGPGARIRSRGRLPDTPRNLGRRAQIGRARSASTTWVRSRVARDCAGHAVALGPEIRRVITAPERIHARRSSAVPP